MRRIARRLPRWGVLAAVLVAWPGPGRADFPPPPGGPAAAEYLALGMPLAAREELSSLPPSARGRSPVLPTVMRDLAYAGFADQALSLFETVRPHLEEPVRSGAYLAAGRILWELGDRKAAARAFREVSGRSDAAPEAMLQLGRHLAAEGNASEAIRALSAAGVGDRAALYAGEAQMLRNDRNGALAAWSGARGATPAGFVARILALSTGEITDDRIRGLREIAGSPGAGFPERAAALEALSSALLRGGDPAGALAAAREGLSLAARWKPAAADVPRWEGTDPAAAAVWGEISARYPHGEDARAFFAAGRRFLARAAQAEGARKIGYRARELAGRVRRAEEALTRARSDLVRAIGRTEEIGRRFRSAGERSAGVPRRLRDAADDLSLSKWGAETDPGRAALLDAIDTGVRELTERHSVLVAAYRDKLKREWSPPLPPKDRLTVLLAQISLDRLTRRLPEVAGTLPFLRAGVWNRWKAEYAARLSPLLDRAESAVTEAGAGAERAGRLGARLRREHADSEMWIARLRGMTDRLTRQDALLSERRTRAQEAAKRELTEAVRELGAAVPRAERRLHRLAARAATEVLIAGRTPAQDNGARTAAERGALREEALDRWRASLDPAGGGKAEEDEALYAMAELRYETEEYRFYGGRHADGGHPDFSTALSLFRKVADGHPGSLYAEPALYGAAVCLQGMGREEESARVLETLLARHPGTRYAGEAHLRLGEHAFGRGDLRRAEEHYRRVGDGSPADLRATARFKQGWTLYLRGRARDAADEFLSALLLSADARRTGGAGAEALGMLARSLVDSGADSGAETFLARRGASEHGPAALLAIQSILDAQNRYADAALAADRFGRAYPLDSARVDAELAAAEALKKGNRAEESLRRKMHFHRVFGPGSRWQQARGRRTAEIDRANRVSEEGLRSAAFFFHGRSRDAAPEERAEAMAGYDAYLSLFPSAADAGEVAYQRAWLLFEEGRKRDAAGAFEAAAERYGGPRAEAARYMALQSAKDAATPSDASSQTEVARLCREYERAFPAAERLPLVLLDRARAHANLGEHRGADAAAGRAADALPPGEARASALRLSGDSRFALEDFAGAESRFRSVLASSPGADLSAEMSRWIGFSMFRRAERTAGEQAAVLFRRVAREFPSLEIAPVALFRSGTAFAEAGKIREAIPALLSVESRAPRTPLSLDAARWLAKLYETAGEPVAAAERYELLGSMEPGGGEKRALWLRAADLFAGSDGPRSRRNLLAVASLPDTPPPLRISSLFRAAESARAEGLPDEADRLYGEAAAAHREAPEAAPGTAAKAYFRRAERRFARYLPLSIAPPLEKSLAAKQAALEEAAALYVEAIRLGDGETAAASLHRLGEGFEEFRTALLASIPPQGLSAGERDEYVFLLEEKAGPVEEKAVEAYRENVRRAVAAGHFSSWVAMSLARLRTLRPARFAKRWEYAFPVVTLPAFRGITERTVR